MGTLDSEGNEVWTPEEVLRDRIACEIQDLFKLELDIDSGSFLLGFIEEAIEEAQKLEREKH